MVVCLFNQTRTLRISLLKLIVAGSIALLLNGCLGGSSSCKSDEALDTMTGKCVKKGDLGAGDPLDSNNASVQVAADLRFSLAAFGNDAEIVRLTDTATLDDHLIREIHGKSLPGEICPNYPNYKTVHVGIKPGATAYLFVRSRFASKSFNNYIFSADDGTINDGVQSTGLSPLQLRQSNALTQVVPNEVLGDPFWPGPSDSAILEITVPPLPNGVDYYTYRIHVWGQRLTADTHFEDRPDVEWEQTDHVARPFSILVHVLRPIEEPLHIVRVNRWDEAFQQYVKPNRFPELYDTGALGNGINEIWASAFVKFNVQYHELNSHYDLDQDGFFSQGYDKRKKNDEEFEIYKLAQEVTSAGITGNVALVVSRFVSTPSLLRSFSNTDSTVAMMVPGVGFDLYGTAACEALEEAVAKDGVFYYNSQGRIEPMQFAEPFECERFEIDGFVGVEAEVEPSPVPFQLPNRTSLLMLSYTYGIAPYHPFENMILISEDIHELSGNIAADGQKYIQTFAHELGHSLFKLFHAINGWAGVQEPDLSRHSLMGTEPNVKDTWPYIGNHCTPLSSIGETSDDRKPPAQQRYVTLQVPSQSTTVYYQQPWLHVRHNRYLPWSNLPYE